MKRALLALVRGPAGTLPDALSTALLTALVLGLFGGSSAAAQADMDFTGEGETGGGADMDFTGAEGGESDMDFTEGGDTSGEGGESDMDFTEGGGTGGDAGGGDVIGDLASEGGEEVDGTARQATSTREASEEIFAVQQIYALRINRVELTPSYAQTLNDPFVSHPAISLGLNYWWTNVLAIGVNFLWYEGLESESDLNFFVRRNTRLAVPVSSYQFAAHLAFSYVPIYGKFAMFNEFIFQWDAYVLGGVGFMRTRPGGPTTGSVVDPEIRHFDYDFRVAFNVGMGIRVFVSRWLAIFGEIRDYMYLEQLEALQVGLGAQRTREETWTHDSPAFTSNVTVHLGLTIFFPFDFEYRLPR